MRKLKKDKIICALSGGVDSSVVALLISKIKKKSLCIMVDTGLMREKNEFNYIYNVLKKKYRLNIKLVKSFKVIFT